MPPASAAAAIAPGGRACRGVGLTGPPGRLTGGNPLAPVTTGGGGGCPGRGGGPGTPAGLNCPGGGCCCCTGGGCCLGRVRKGCACDIMVTMASLTSGWRAICCAACCRHTIMTGSVSGGSMADLPAKCFSLRGPWLGSASTGSRLCRYCTMALMKRSPCSLIWSPSHLSRLRYSLREAITARSMTKGTAFELRRMESAFRSCATSRIRLSLAVSSSPSDCE